LDLYGKNGEIAKMTGSGNKNVILFLKCSFIIGAITDALALIPMLCLAAAKIMWGFNSFSPSYYFAMGYGSSLMFAWTILLIWAYRKPLERRIIALLTTIVIIGLVVTEITTAICGYIDIHKLIPTFILQSILLFLFSFSFIKSKTIVSG